MQSRELWFSQTTTNATTEGRKIQKARLTIHKSAGGKEGAEKHTQKKIWDSKENQKEL